MDIESAPHDHADVVIFGGGAIAGRAARYRTRGKKIAWGVGNTVRGKYGPENIRHDTRGFELYGSRDFGHGEWVPCASCMSEFFDIPGDPSRDTVTYGHADLSPMDGMNNDYMSLASVVKYLSSGETIVTSSYHGMYWGLLLGRTVRVKPFGSKFFGLPWEFAWDGEWMTFIADQSRLDECRSANLAFWERVKGLSQ